jgi:hypothetical protein
LTSGVFVLLAIICAFILAVGINQPFLVLSTHVCVVSRAVDDEAHCLFSCAHPNLLLAAIVPPLAHSTFSLPMLTFGPWRLHAVSPRNPVPVEYVAVCVRVCWSCHRSGGTDVVDIPDVFLPAEAYLDLSDSSGDLGKRSDSDAELVEVS